MQGKFIWRAALLATVACALSTENTAYAQTQADAAINYDIPAQDLANTLLSIARLSGRDVLFASEAVRGRIAPAIKGRLTFDQAIRAALAGSSLGLEYRAGAALIRQRTTGAADAGNGAGGSAATITVTGTRIRGVGSASPVHVR